jgi:hypothetical protein
MNRRFIIRVGFLMFLSALLLFSLLAGEHPPGRKLISTIGDARAEDRRLPAGERQAAEDADPSDSEWAPPHPEREFEQALREADDAAQAISSFARLITEATKEQADRMLLQLESFYEEDLKRAERMMRSPHVRRALEALPSEEPIVKEALERIANPEAKRTLLTLYDGLYSIVQIDGVYQPIVDYDALLAFEMRFSDAIQSYVALRAEESRQAAASEERLAISRAQLKARIRQAEAYLANFPDSPRREQVQQMYTAYLRILVFGLEESPVYDTRTYRVRKEVEEELAMLVAEQPQSVTGRMVFNYLTVLKQTKGRMYVKYQRERVPVSPLKQFMDDFERRVAVQLGSPHMPSEKESMTIAAVYGKWTVERVVAATPISAMPAEEREAWVGKKAYYTKDRAKFGEDVLQLPEYEPFVMTDGEFAQQFSLPITDIGVKESFVSGMRVTNWTAPGSLFFAVEDRLVTLWDGIFFELKRE